MYDDNIVYMAIVVDEHGSIASKELKAETLAIHFKEWAADRAAGVKMVCGQCGADLPLGFIHVGHCNPDELWPIWH